MSTDLAPAVYDKSAITRARRLGAWGPGLLTKSEGLWETEAGTFIVGERTEGAAEVSYRLTTAEGASELLRAHGHKWRAGYITRTEAAAAEAAAAEAAAEEAADAPTAAEDVATEAPAPTRV